MPIKTFYVAMPSDALQKVHRENAQQDKDDIGKLISQNGRGGAFSTSKNISGILSSETKMTKYTNIIATSQKLSDKTSDKLDVIEAVHGLMTDFKDEVMRMRSSTQMNNNMFVTKMDRFLHEVESLLNNAPALAGQSEFYNSKVADFSLLTAAPSATTPDYSYCLGGKTGTELHIDDSTAFWDLSNLTSKDPMFEEFIRAIRLAKSGNPSDKTDIAFKHALDLVDSALESSNTALQSTAFLKKTIDDRILKMTDKNAQTQQFYESIATEDLSELFIKSALNEQSLESFSYLFVNSEKSLKNLRELINRVI
jgi:hypothetical protein